MGVSIRSNQFLNPPNVVTYLLLGYIHLPAAVGARLGSDRGFFSIAGKYSHAPRTGNPKTLCFSFESTDECSPTLA